MENRTNLLSAVYLILFALLVLAGIALKRIWDLPQFMMLFHLPAAVFLVLGGIELKKKRQQFYDAEVEAIQARFGAGEPGSSEELEWPDSSPAGSADKDR